MGLMVRDTGGDFDPIPQGHYIAICTVVADLGLQQGGPYKPRHQIVVVWEIPTCTYEARLPDGSTEERPRTISKFYTASLSERANLRHDLEAWRGRPFTEQELEGFDMKRVLGAPCQMVIAIDRTQNGKMTNKIMGMMPLPPGYPRPAPVSTPVLYSDEEQGQFDLLPNWIQNRVRPPQQGPQQPQYGQRPGSQFSTPPVDAFAGQTSPAYPPPQQNYPPNYPQGLQQHAPPRAPQPAPDDDGIPGFEQPRRPPPATAADVPFDDDIPFMRHEGGWLV